MIDLCIFYPLSVIIFQKTEKKSDTCYILTKGAMVMVRILLSKLLGERRWTQADLARATGIRAATINEYYNELSERVTLKHLELICRELECELSDLLVIIPDEEYVPLTKPKRHK